LGEKRVKNGWKNEGGGRRRMESGGEYGEGRLREATRCWNIECWELELDDAEEEEGREALKDGGLMF
jgi:hypothetical protein